MSNLTIIPKKNKASSSALPPLDKKAIATFLADNPSLNLQKFNFFNAEKVEALQWNQQDIATLLPQLKALQRLIRLTDNLETAETLYEQGLHAAVQIATIPAHQFVKEYAHVFKPNGLSSEQQARQVHQQALARKSKTVLTYTAIAQQRSPYYRATRFDNLSALTDSNYDNIPSYQDLFGDLDFCTCPDCRSIFSPAAYFVDLMRLQDKYISIDPNANPPAQLLKTRRPDLWTIPLDCDHTNTLVPKLQIVNGVLLKVLGFSNYDSLTTTNYPFNLPFNLPFTQINLYLSSNNQTLAGIWEVLIPQQAADNLPTIARQSLQISPEQWTLYSTTQTDPVIIAKLYGLFADPDTKYLVYADTFLTQSGLTYEELQSLLDEDLSEEEIKLQLNSQFFINVPDNSNDPMFLNIEPAATYISNLTAGGLDHMHRLIRLSQVLGWSFTDLDWALRTIGNIVNSANQGAPVINNDAVPYLAWIYALQQENNLSINQCCALIGTLKDFGLKNGPGTDFFDQVFNNPTIPNLPIWRDDSGNYNLIWNVPTNDPNYSPTTDDIKIQNALGAVLQLSQDNLLSIALKVLAGTYPKNNQLQLSLINLSTFYRLSQLPVVTGLSVQECFIILSLPGQPTDAFYQMAGSAGKGAYTAFMRLQQFSQWLKNTHFSVYQLQFILTGSSQNPTIQNQVLGANQIANFLNNLYIAVQPALFTVEHLTTVLYPTLQSAFGDEANGLVTLIYNDLQSTIPKYFSQQGVITAAGNSATVEQIKAIISLPANSNDQIATLITNILQNSYELQQNTLTQQLASLYNIPPNLVPALEKWGNLTLEELEADQSVAAGKIATASLLQHILSKPITRWSKATVLAAENEDVVKCLVLLQQYAVLLTTLALSPAEVQAMINSPAYFGLSYDSTGKPNFTLANIQTLYQFKQLVAQFQDTQNHLLDYFTTASQTTDPATIASQLALITQWDEDQIQYLISALWSTPDPANPDPWATVTGVAQLQAYFNIAQQLDIDIPTLWKLTQAINPTDSDYATLQQLATALWAGLQKKYEDQPNQLASLESNLDEIKRSALLDLVISTLRPAPTDPPPTNPPPISTARDLYEYLLIDVEVSGAVQTSYIQEAISAVQLYLYRCMNHLEAGITIQEELYQWWDWMNHYRVWQANREVFLYPENYIQPELRLGKTPQFIQLENDLQQSHLTADVIDKAVKGYIDGFATVATLQIVGSYLYNPDPNKPQTQVLYLVGRTTTQAYTYYYRQATIVIDTDGSVESATWTPWLAIDVQIKSTMASPVYAFDRLFLFWAEAKPGPSDIDPTSGRPTTKRFETTLYYAFYDFNKRWSAPQQLLDPILLPDTVNTQAAAEAAVWQQVRTLFIPMFEVIYWTWGSTEAGAVQSGNLNQQLKPLTSFVTLSFDKLPIILGCPSLVEFQGGAYFFYFNGSSGTGSLSVVAYKNGNWQQQQEDPIPSVTTVAPPSAIVDPNTNTLYCFYAGASNQLCDLNVQGNSKWNDAHIEGSSSSAKPSGVVYKDTLYCLYLGVSNSCILGCATYQENKWSDSHVLEKDVKTSGSPSTVQYQDTLYCFYPGVDQSHFPNPDSQFWYVTTDDGKTWTNPNTPLAGNYAGSPSAVVYQNTLYCFGQGVTNNSPDHMLWYVSSNDGTNWSSTPTQVPGVTIYSDPYAVVYQDILYCFYQGPNNLLYGTIIKTNLDNSVQSYLDAPSQSVGFSSDIVPGLTSTWSIDVGPDGTQFLTIPVNNKPNQEIRLNSTVVYELSQILFSQGMDTFLSLTTQETPEVKIDGTLTDTLDFAGANGLYYWELFFHMPFLVAHSLSTQQQFELAKSWYEYIFNPTIPQKEWNLITDESPNDKYWRFLQLRSEYNSTLQAELSEDWDIEVQADVKDDSSQLKAYHDDPFDPHAIAALRPIAYQKTLVMHYIDNLLDWADNLFRQYTNETIVEATMLYIMAYDLLGKQPVSLGACDLPPTDTLQDIVTKEGSLQQIPEFLIDVEQAQGKLVAVNIADTPHNYIPGDYFGLPENDQFIAYWGKVEQRLFNIRHSLNIDGVAAQLALFQPPINPMQLVAAIAAGQGVTTALAGNQVTVPYYRFSAMIGQAQAVVQTVIQLGQSLLSVLEKQDAEQLALLYNSNQQILLSLTRTSKQDQLDAATQTLAALQASLQNAQIRLTYYTQLLNDGLSSGEQAQIALEGTAIYVQTSAQPIKDVSIAGFLMPTVYGLADGDFKPGDAIAQGASILEGSANALSMAAGLAGTVAGYQRRAQDWQLQQSLAQADVSQIQAQILAAQYQQNMANEDIMLLEKQIEQEQAVAVFLKNKFTRAQLYQWMVGQIATLYFQAYQLAYNLGLQAEKAWQFERGKDQTFINPVYWNDLYHGLVAGEALQFDLQRMGKAYMDQNGRSLEIVKTISLAQLDPQALYNLRATGSCNFDLAEKDFDCDYPGHYCRQIKTISLSFPALIGPYQNLHATLIQTANKTLLQANADGVKYLLGVSGTSQPDSSVLRVDMCANQQVALSQGLSDSGLFVLNFEDERYLPFEGTGVISSWQLRMPKKYNPINFDSITDVIIQMRYTALPGDNAFTKTVEDNLGKFNGYQAISMAQTYASAWYAFINQGQPLPFIVGPALFRPNLSSYTVTDIVILIFPTAAGQAGFTEGATLDLASSAFSSTLTFSLAKDPTTGLVAGYQSGQTISVGSSVEWDVKTTDSSATWMTSANVSNMVIILGYTAQFS